MGRPLPEPELVARAKSGDAAAYEELVRAHQAIAFRTAYLVAGNEADAQEAAQDAFVKAYRALGRFRTGAPFWPWLLRIVANEARNRRRSAARRQALVLRASALVSAERSRELLSALERLAEDHRLVLACRYFLELSEDETAATLGVRRGTVKSRLARARERLRAELQEDENG